MKLPTLVLVSGGLDSAVVLHWATLQGPVATLTFDRPDRPRGERLATKAILDAYHVKQRFTADYPGPRPEWVQGSTARGWIPARNLFQIAAACLLAKRIGAKTVALGHLASDAREFGDATPRFLRTAQRLANADGGPPVKIVAPLASLSKADVVRRGLRWGVPLDLTWSCYRDGSRPCGRCVPCKERRAALALPDHPVRP